MTMANFRKAVSDASGTLRDMIRNKKISEGYEFLRTHGIRQFLEDESAAFSAEGGKRAAFKPREAKLPKNKEGIMRNAIYNQRSVLIGRRRVFLFYEEGSTKKAKKGLGGRVDLLGVDKAGRTYLLELKHLRDRKTSVLETLFQVLTYRAHFAHRASPKWWKPVFTSAIERCSSEDTERKDALERARDTKRRSFAALAVLQKGMGQLKVEKKTFRKLLNRRTNNLASREIVGVVSIDKDKGYWRGVWHAGRPANKEW